MRALYAGRDIFRTPRVTSKRSMACQRGRAGAMVMRLRRIPTVRYNERPWLIRPDREPHLLKDSDGRMVLFAQAG